MKKSTLRFLVTLLALCIALGSLSGAALAASVYAADGDSYIRSQPSLFGSQLGTLREGATAEYLGRSSVDGRGVTWYYIRYNGKTGWVSSTYTTLYGSTSNSTVTAIGGDCYIRSQPNLYGAELGLLPEGASATYLEEDSWDDRGVVWYRVRYSGKTGWVSSRYATLPSDYAIDHQFYEYEPDYSYGTLYASGDTYLRTSPNLSAPLLIVIPDGASATYLGEDATDSRGVSWYYASYGGLVGWVSSRYTSFSRSRYSYAGDGTVYASGGDSYIRSQPSLSGAQLALFPDGASATYLDSSSVDSRGVTWYRVSYRGTTGWVSSKYTYLD